MALVQLLLSMAQLPPHSLFRVQTGSMKMELKVTLYMVCEYDSLVPHVIQSII